MPRDIDPLTSALEYATPGKQSDVYSLLAAWNQSIQTALDRGGWSRLQEIRDQYLEGVIDLFDTAATADGIDWTFLEECVDAYPPGVGDHHCSSILANVVARCVIRTRIREGIDTIPTWALEYLADVTVKDDSEWAWESTAAFGWAVGHPKVAVLDRALERAESGDDSWAMGILTHATFAEPEAGIDLLEQLLESPDVVEDLVFVGCLHAPFEQDFPDFPQYWEPDTELDYQVEISDGLHERLLAVIGSSINPGRLRHFDDSYRFNLERAADEYGPGNDT
ncbi:hypothetical protein [Natrinema hispanicum]|uniref:HEAT repeat domain-containing protein n=1 Tax=Natrinema hispanicum TaxID=392421 RepID=A0A1G6XTJ0_9EURY|nr:hypothetical protein [Natrinema hispanicum]SDD80707.1 hypothetical protein SAMN05192552_10516 [Natrinema hispanicum]SET97529.1 hypothetical protein SAMN04488694_12211 [Natrinema hispanicum]